MKKVKYLLSLLIMVVFVLSLGSCSKDDKKYEQYEGLYRISEYLYYQYSSSTGASLVAKTQSELNQLDGWIELKADGKCTHHEFVEDFFDANQYTEETRRGTFSVEDKDSAIILSIELPDVDTPSIKTVYTYEIIGNTLVFTLKSDLGVNGIQTKITYTKAPAL
jgi:hypothetical protein